MTYETDVESAIRHTVGFYLKLDGVAERFSSHHPDRFANWNPSETFYEVIEWESVSLASQMLDRRVGIVQVAGFALNLTDTPETRAIFKRGGGTYDVLDESISHSGTTVKLRSGTSTWADGTLVHVGREAITLGTHTAGGTYTGCTRAAEDTSGEPHLAGVSISDTPHHWKGRRGWLYAVNLKTGTERSLRVGLLDDYPNDIDGGRSFNFVGMASVLKRPILTGWEEQPIAPGYPVRAQYDFHPSGHVLEGLQFKVADGRQLADDGFVMFDVEGESTMVPLYAAQSNLDSAGTFIVTWIKLAGNGPNEDEVQKVLDASDISVRQVDRIVARPGIATLHLMLSRYGDGNNNSTYDRLPGRAPNQTTDTEDLAPKRVGAGVPVAWVDLNSFLDMDGHTIRCIIDERTTLDEWLVDEVLWRSGGYIYCDHATGRIAFKRYQPLTIRGSLPSLTRADIEIGEVQSESMEREQLSQLLFRCNWVPGVGYTKTVSVLFEDTVDAFEDDPGSVIELKAKSVWVGSAQPRNVTADPITAAALRGQADRWRAAGSEGVLRIPIPLPWDFHVDYVEGFRFSLTDDRILDADGNRGVSAMPVEVVGTHPDPERGKWNIVVEQLHTGVRVAPSAIVDSYDAGSRTITFKTTGHAARLFNSSPGGDWGEDMRVRIYDADDAGGVYAASETNLVGSTTNNTMTLQGIPTTAPAEWDLVVLEDEDESGQSENDEGGLTQDYAFGADANGVIGTGAYEREANKWR